MYKDEYESDEEGYNTQYLETSYILDHENIVKLLQDWDNKPPSKSMIYLIITIYCTLYSYH